MEEITEDRGEIKGKKRIQLGVSTRTGGFQLVNEFRYIDDDSEDKKEN